MKAGGILYIGIDDDLTVYGVENPDEIQRQIADRIKNNIRGECLGLYDIVLEKRNAKIIVKIIISSGTEKPLPDEPEIRLPSFHHRTKI